MRLHHRFYQILFIMISLLIVHNYSYAQSTSEQPRDLQQFLKNAKTCRHHLAKKDKILSLERLKNKDNQIPAYCKTFKQEQKRLQRKYKYNKFILNLILKQKI